MQQNARPINLPSSMFHRSSVVNKTNSTCSAKCFLHTAGGKSASVAPKLTSVKIVRGFLCVEQVNFLVVFENLNFQVLFGGFLAMLVDVC